LIGKALRLPLRLLPSDAQVIIVQGPLRGKKWIAGSSNHGCWLGSYERAKQKAFAATIRPGDVVYDLGANVGFYSLLASVLVGPLGQVASFEPVPRNLEFLRTHMELNDVSNCSIFDAAVCNSNGKASFDFGAGSLMGHLTAKPEGAFTVRTVTLDRLVDSGELRPPNVVKCDIEGAEYDALAGAIHTVARWLPVIFLATHGPEVHERCCKLLGSIGYQLASLDNLPLEKTSEIVAFHSN
jgi:FkbM family methyltransferase